jgi:branched-chain amino acid transport system ATP-binding protein
MLHVQSLKSWYGRSQALFDVNLEVRTGEVVTLLGRNGMGKTTTVRSIMGLLRPRSGMIEFDGLRIDGLQPEAIAAAGIGLVPAGRQVFPTLTVRENLIATAADRLHSKTPWTLARIEDLFPPLRERANSFASTLSGGEQQMLAIGRALMTNPRLLIFDEATEGLAPLIRAEIWRCIETLKQQGYSILVIDKNIKALIRLASRHFIIEKGRTVWSGTSQQLSAAPDIIRQYCSI